MRAASIHLIVLLLSGACTRPLEPYDIDAAYCRRAAAPPSTMVPSGSTFFGAESGARSESRELATGMLDQRFDSCMRDRFHERFPGVPYPLDP